MRIHICGVEKIDPCFQTDVYQTSGFGYVAIAPFPEELTTAAKCARAETENWDL